MFKEAFVVINLNQIVMFFSLNTWPDGEWPIAMVLGLLSKSYGNYKQKKISFLKVVTPSYNIKRRHLNKMTQF